MIGGRNDNIDILGRSIHVETEATAGDRPVLRTTVYSGGRVVGNRETPLNPDDVADELREQLNAQHTMIIDNLIKRAERLLERRPQTPPPCDALPPAAAPRELREVERPDPQATPELAGSIRTRRLVGAFSRAVDRLPCPSEVELQRRLETVLKSIAYVMSAAGFAETRLDEQLRFFDLRDRLATWQPGCDDPAATVKLWSEAVVFADYVEEISNRAELVRFDHQLLTWTLYQIGRGGVDRAVLDDLGSLSGRDAALDRLLGSGEDVSSEALVEVLLRLLEDTLPETL